MAQKKGSRGAGGTASSKKAGAAGAGKNSAAGKSKGVSSSRNTAGSSSTGRKGNGSRSTQGRSTANKSPQGKPQQGSSLKGRDTRREPTSYSLAWEIVTWVVIAVSVLLFISTFGFGGSLGKAFSSMSFGMFGVMAYIFPFALFLLASFFISNHASFVAKMKILGWFLLFVTLCGVLQLILVGYNSDYSLQEYYEAGALYRVGGGLTGGALTHFFANGVGVVGTFIVYLMLLVISLILITQKSLFTGVKRGGKRIAVSALNTKDRSIHAFRRFLQEREEALRAMGDSDTLYDPDGDEPGEYDPETYSSKGYDREKGRSEKYRPGKGETPKSGDPSTGRELSTDDFGGDFSVLPKERRLEKTARGVIGDTRLSPQVMESSSRKDQAEGERPNSGTGSVFSDDFRIRGLDGAGTSSPALRGATPEDTVGAADGNSVHGGNSVPGSKADLGLSGSVQTGQGSDGAAFGASAAGKPGGKRNKGVSASGIGSIFRSGKDNTVATSSGKVAGVPSSADSGFGAGSLTAVDGLTEKEMAEAASRADQLIGQMNNASRAGAGTDRSGRAARSAGAATALDAGGVTTAENGQTALPDGIGSRKKRSSDQEIAEGISQVAGEIADNAVEIKREYVLPSPELLSEKKVGGSGTTEQELRETAERLAQVFQTFGVNVKITNVTCGPSVTRYELMPQMGVKVSKIVSLQDDIQLNLAVTDIRIEAPIPGKSAVGIEVPNKKPTGVFLRELLESEEFKKAKSNLTYAVGKDIGGRIIVADIAKMPHLLIAGSTGSGKSVFINTLIMSILYKAKPEDVKLIMIDPKVVELSVYNGIPHLFIPVVTDPKKAAGALNWAVAEMMARYQKFADTGVRDLKGYNARVDQVRAQMEAEAKKNARKAQEKAAAQDAAISGSGNGAAPENGTALLQEDGQTAQAAQTLQGVQTTQSVQPAPMPEKLPQIVIIVDELADLMMVASSEVEDAICRLAQLARAAGIHLVIATQRPSVDVITGLIKANMPSRIAFAVSSGVDSRTILDQVGAEKLLGNGDMFFSPQTYKQPLRVQGAYVSDQEVADVVDFLKEQTDSEASEKKMAQRMEEVAKSAAASSSGAGGGGDTDELFEQAARFIIEKDKASIGMLQRWFKIGFNRAARIMDQLSEAGVVGPDEGTKPRKVEMSMEQFENYLEQG